jgi:hypothetical protein
MTDANGEFSLTTGGRPGVLVGEHKVSIAKAPPAPVQAANPSPEDMRKMQMSGGMTTEPVKSEIPEKYANQPQAIWWQPWFPTRRRTSSSTRWWTSAKRVFGDGRTE